MKKANSKPDSLTALRKKAERSLRGRMDKLKSLSTRDVRDLVHELGTHQIELEMQNEELRRAQEELEASRSRYAELYDFAPVGYFTFDRHGLIVETNLAGATMFGMSRRHLVRQPFSRFIESTEGRMSFSAHLAAVMREKEKTGCELRLRGKNGAKFYAELRSIPAEDDKGDVTLIRTAVSDITGRKRGEEELRESEAQFRAFYESPAVGAAHIDLRGRFFRVNDQFCRITGYSREELLKRSVGDLTHPGDRRGLESLHRCLKGELPHYDGEQRYLRKDGGSVWVHISAAIVRDAKGVPLYATGIIQDVTDRKKAEEALGESERRLNKTQQIAQLGSWELDLARNTLAWSEETYRIFGIEPREFGATYEAFLEAVHPDDRAAVDAAYSGSIREGKDSYEIEHRIVRRSTGEVRNVREKCEHVRDASGRIVRSSGMVYDITEIRLADERIKRLASFPQMNPNPVIEVDSAGRTVFANESARQILKNLALEAENMAPFLPADMDALLREWGGKTASTAHRNVTIKDRVFEETVHFVPQFGVARIYVFEITRSKRAEETLRKQLQLINLANDAIIIREYATDTITYWNEGAEKLYGWQQQSVLGKSTHEILKTRFPRPAEEIRKELLESGRWAGELYHTSRDGKVICVLSRWTLQKGPSPQENYYIEINTDITERKRAEKAVTESEEQFRSLFSQSPIAIELYDVEGGLIGVNPACQRLFGIQGMETVKGFFLFDDPNIPADAKQRLRNGESIHYETRFDFDVVTAKNLYETTRSGKCFIECFINRWNTSSGELRGYLVFVTDITERKHAEEVLRKSEVQFRSFFESTAVGTAQIDLRGRFFLVNEQFCRITGYSREELLEMTVAELTHPGERDGLEILSRYLRGELPQYDVEKRYRRKDGRVVWVHVSATLVRDADGEPVYSTGIIQDITDRKVAQEKIARKSEVLAQISRLFRDALGYDTEKALAADCLAAAVTATQSGYGFIGEIGPDGMLHDIAMSDAARNACSLPEKTGHRVPSADFTMCGLNGKVLMEGRPFFTNDPAAHPDRHGTPDGHPPLASFLGVPLLSGEDVIGVVAVANREGGYEIEQQEALEALAPVIVEAIGRKRTESALKRYRTGLEQRVQERTAQVEEQARVLGAFFKHTPTCLVILDREFNFVLVNEAYARTCSRSISDFSEHNYFTDYPSDDLRKEFQRVVDTGRPYSAASRPFEFPGKPEQGVTYWDLAVSSILDERGTTELVVFSLVDVTGRKRSDERISRLNRLYTVLSRVNEAIVRIRGRQELFERICRIAVEDGSLSMVWIGLTDPETLRVSPVASYGDTGGYLDAVMKHIPRDPGARSPADTAVHEGREVICDDIKQDIIMLPWRDLTLGHGFHSMASIPLRGESGVIGAFSFYADSSWFFADDEIGLLLSLADDVSFAVQGMEKERRRVEAEERTRTTNELLALFSRTFGRKAYLDAVVELIRRSCNCSAAGIRVLDDFGNISYEASAGFNERFLAREQTLSLERDSCVCTRMSLDAPEPQDLPAITPGGSFFSNNTARFMDGLAAGQRSRFRGFCLREGYLTVGVVPVRYRDKVHGLIHVADEREGKAPPACVEFLEQAALFIGEALFRFGVEEESFRLAAAVESAADAVVITEPARGVIQYVNAAFTRVTGYSPEEAVGRTLHILDSGKHDGTFYRNVRDAIDRDGVWNGRLISRKKDGTLYFEDCTFSPVKSPAGEIVSYVSIKRDVTERLRLESIAESDNLMSNIGYVFSGVRHEIGNPINSARMALSVLRQKLGRIGTEAVRDYVDRTLAEIGRVEQLLKNLRNFNLYETPEVAYFDMAAFLERFAGLVANDLAKKGIAFSRELMPGAESALADPRALQQVLLNIVTNAVDALEGRPDPLITITVERLRDRIAVRVADNGAGMTESQQQDMFKPFYTTKTGGTGLGMVIVKKMLSQMNCDIEIASTPDKGTEVNIILPEGTNAKTR